MIISGWDTSLKLVPTRNESTTKFLTSPEVSWLFPKPVLRKAIGRQAYIIIRKFTFTLLKKNQTLIGIICRFFSH